MELNEPTSNIESFSVIKIIDRDVRSKAIFMEFIQKNCEGATVIRHGPTYSYLLRFNTLERAKLALELLINNDSVLVTTNLKIFHYKSCSLKDTEGIECLIKTTKPNSPITFFTTEGRIKTSATLIPYFGRFNNKVYRRAITKNRTGDGVNTQKEPSDNKNEAIQIDSPNLLNKTPDTVSSNVVVCIDKLDIEPPSVKVKAGEEIDAPLKINKKRKEEHKKDKDDTEAIFGGIADNMEIIGSSKVQDSKINKKEDITTTISLKKGK